MRDTVTGTHHRVRWVPRSGMGWWTVALAAASAAGLVLLGLAFALGLVESAPGFTANWLLTGWGAAILVSGAASAVVGTLTIIRHERSWTTLAATLLGLLVAVLLLREVAQGL